MHGSEDWLQQWKSNHPDRVHDPADHPTPYDGDEAPDAGGGDVVRAAYRFEDNQPPMLNEIIRMHWSEWMEVKRTWQWLVEEQGTPSVQEPVVVHMQRVTTEWPLDVDNLVGAFKVLLDALVNTGVISDDNLTVVRDVCYDVKKTRSEEDQQTILVVEHADATDGETADLFAGRSQ